MQGVSSNAFSSLGLEGEGIWMRFPQPVALWVLAGDFKSGWNREEKST